jgi:hypothetical protein
MRSYLGLKFLSSAAVVLLLAGVASAATSQMTRRGIGLRRAREIKGQVLTALAKTPAKGRYRTFEPTAVDFMSMSELPKLTVASGSGQAFTVFYNRKTRTAIHEAHGEPRSFTIIRNIKGTPEEERLRNVRSLRQKLGSAIRAERKAQRAYSRLLDQMGEDRGYEVDGFGFEKSPEIVDWPDVRDAERSNPDLAALRDDKDLARRMKWSLFNDWQATMTEAERARAKRPEDLGL